MPYAIFVVSLFMSLLCTGKALGKDAIKFDKIFFAIMSIVFLLLAFVPWTGGIKRWW